jgi:hypothetical protein
MALFSDAIESRGVPLQVELVAKSAVVVVVVPSLLSGLGELGRGLRVGCMCWQSTIASAAAVLEGTP